MAVAGKFSCAECGKSYAWKPELAGKRVKCKCGKPLTVPTEDPAAAPVEAGGFDDLMALADGAAVEAPVMAAPASPAGAACPSCGRGVTPGAVMCVNCGFNLKTGKKLKTQKVAGGAAAAAGGGMASNLPYDNRGFGIKSVGDEGKDPKKNKIIAFACVGLLVAVVGGVVAIKVADPQGHREREKKLAAQKPKLERLIDNMDKAGGVGAAMKDGTLLNGVERPSQKVDQSHIDEKNMYRLNVRGSQMNDLTNAPIAKEWIKAPNARFRGMTREDSLAAIDKIIELGGTNVKALDPTDVEGGFSQCFGMVVTLPKDEEKRAKIFRWYRQIGNTIEPLDMPQQRDYGQDFLVVEFVSKDE